MQWLKKVVRLLCPVVHQESHVSDAVAQKGSEMLCPIVYQEIHETFHQKGEEFMKLRLPHAPSNLASLQILSRSETIPVHRVWYHIQFRIPSSWPTPTNQKHRKWDELPKNERNCKLNKQWSSATGRYNSNYSKQKYCSHVQLPACLPTLGFRSNSEGSRMENIRLTRRA